jgi:hemoglobin
MRLLRCGTALLAVCLAAGPMGFGRAQEQKTDAPAAPPLERKALDVAVFNTLRDVINRGADLYNAPTNDFMGCYHLYEGSLLVVRPLLDHRPALQKDIEMALIQADRTPNIPEKAYVLRRVMDKIRDEVNPSPMAKSLWQRLGGEKGVGKVVDDFLTTAAPDPKVNFFRKPDAKPTPEQVAALRKSLIAFFSAATGGPIKYTGPSMKEVHKGMKITDAEFDALAGHLQKALEKNGVAPDDIKAVMGAVGGTRKDIVESSLPPPQAKTLWERLGGEAGVAKVVDDLFAIAGPDPKVNFFRKAEVNPTPEQVAALKKSVIAFFSAATGGPIKYEGKSMKEAHAGMMITDAEFDAFAADLQKALEKNNVAPDDIKAVMTAVGGTRKDIVEKK